MRPYFEPFHRMAWLVEESDFDLESSSVEFAVAQLAEILGTHGTTSRGVNSSREEFS